MYMSYQNSSKKRNIFLVSDDVHPQTLAVVQTRAGAIGVTVVSADWNTFDLSKGIQTRYVDHEQVCHRSAFVK